MDRARQAGGLKTECTQRAINQPFAQPSPLTSPHSTTTTMPKAPTDTVFSFTTVYDITPNEW